MAILRTAEAMGVQTIWFVNAARKKLKKHKHTLNAAIARTSVQWLTVRHFDTSVECIEAIQALGMEIWATDLGQGAERLEKGVARVPACGIALIVGKEST